MKRFKNWEEAKNYSYPKESKSNYYCVKVDDECGVFIEVTPLWITITIQKKNIAKKRDFPLKGKTVQNVIYEAFK